jgi:hypothetical protein
MSKCLSILVVALVILAHPAGAVYSADTAVTGVLLSGSSSGLFEVDVASGQVRHVSFARRLLDPAIGPDKTIYAESAYRIVAVDLAARTVRDVRSGRRPIVLPTGKLVYLDGARARAEKLYAAPSRAGDGALELSPGPYEEFVPVVRLGHARVAYVRSYPVRRSDPAWVGAVDLENSAPLDASAAGQCIPYGWRERTQQILCSKSNNGAFQLAWIDLASGATEWVPKPSQGYIAVVYVEQLDTLFYLQSGALSRERLDLYAYRFADRSKRHVADAIGGWFGSMIWLPRSILAE